MDNTFLINEFQEIKENFLIEKGKYEELLKERESLNKKIEELESDIDTLNKAKLLIVESSIYGKNMAKQEMEELVTNGLQYVFDEELEFHIEFSDINDNRSDTEFIITYDGQPIEDGMDIEEEHGGGIADTVSLILRCNMLQSMKPTLHGPLILDEPSKMVSFEYEEKVGKFLKQMSKTFGRQVIMCTHSPYLGGIADKSFLVKQKNMKSTIEEITIETQDEE